MSEVEILSYIKRILGKYERREGIKSFPVEEKTICTPESCTTILNPQVSLTWNADGYLTEVRISGKDQNGDTRTFRKTLTWSAEGYLQSVSGWEEV